MGELGELMVVLEAPYFSRHQHDTMVLGLLREGEVVSALELRQVRRNTPRAVRRCSTQQRPEIFYVLSAAGPPIAISSPHSRSLYLKWSPVKHTRARQNDSTGRG